MNTVFVGIVFARIRSSRDINIIMNVNVITVIVMVWVSLNAGIIGNFAIFFNNSSMKSISIAFGDILSVLSLPSNYGSSMNFLVLFPSPWCFISGIAAMSLSHSIFGFTKIRSIIL